MFCNNPYPELCILFISHCILDCEVHAPVSMNALFVEIFMSLLYQLKEVNFSLDCKVCIKDISLS